jgi:hypothetical protein
MLVRELVHQHIIHKRALRRRQRRVLNLADRELCRVIRRDVLHRLERIATRDFDLAHVADVEQPGSCPDGVVLVDDAGVFDWHVPAAEFDHTGTKRSMARVERGLLERDGRRLRHHKCESEQHCGPRTRTDDARLRATTYRRYYAALQWVKAVKMVVFEGFLTLSIMTGWESLQADFESEAPSFLQETVHVSAVSPDIQTEKADISAVVERRKIEDLPVVGRNVLSLTALQPGINGIPSTTDIFGTEQGTQRQAPGPAGGPSLQ